MTKKWNMIIDIAECMNCNNCLLACKDEHVGNDFPGYAAAQPAQGHRWIDIKRKDRGQFPMADSVFVPTMCHQCDKAPCIDAAENNAVYQREDGIVIIDPEKAKGQKQIVDACPYNAIYWNDELQLPQKYIFDAHLLDAGWDKLRCEQVCSTNVFKSLKVTDEEMQTIASEQKLEVMNPEFGTRPRTYYKNLSLYKDVFVAGSVATVHDGIEDCVAGASVTVRKGENILMNQETDSFGDFKVDGIEANIGEVELIVTEGDKQLSRTMEIGVESIYLGVLSV